MPPAAPTHVVGRRVAAHLVDAIVLWTVSIAAFLAVADRVPSGFDSTSAATLDIDAGGDRYLLEGGSATLFFMVTGAAWIAYLGVLPGVTGWTPGKLACGIRVTGEDGRPPGGGRGAVRALLWAADGFPYFLPGLTGLVVALCTPRRQRVGDLVAGTFVVRAGHVPETGAPALARDAPPAAAAPGWYADPYGEQRLRYWDGHNWTAHAAP